MKVLISVLFILSYAKQSFAGTDFNGTLLCESALSKRVLSNEFVPMYLVDQTIYNLLSLGKVLAPEFNLEQHMNGFTSQSNGIAQQLFLEGLEDDVRLATHQFDHNEEAIWLINALRTNRSLSVQGRGKGTETEKGSEKGSEKDSAIALGLGTSFYLPIWVRSEAAGRLDRLLRKRQDYRLVRDLDQLQEWIDRLSD